MDEASPWSIGARSDYKKFEKSREFHVRFPRKALQSWWRVFRFSSNRTNSGTETLEGIPSWRNTSFSRSRSWRSWGWPRPTCPMDGDPGEAGEDGVLREETVPAAEAVLPPAADRRLPAAERLPAGHRAEVLAPAGRDRGPLPARAAFPTGRPTRNSNTSTSRTRSPSTIGPRWPVFSNLGVDPEPAVRPPSARGPSAFAGGGNVLPAGVENHGIRP